MNLAANIILTQVGKQLEYRRVFGRTRSVAQLRLLHLVGLPDLFGIKHGHRGTFVSKQHFLSLQRCIVYIQDYWQTEQYAVFLRSHVFNDSVVVGLLHESLQW